MSYSECGLSVGDFDEKLDGNFVRKPWERLRVQSVPEGESMTVQSELDMTDINKIVERYDRTGMLPPGREGQYMDVSHLNADLMDVIAASDKVIIEAEAFFKDRSDSEAKEAADIAKANADLLERAKALLAAEDAKVGSQN